MRYVLIILLLISYSKIEAGQLFQINSTSDLMSDNSNIIDQTSINKNITVKADSLIDKSGNGPDCSLSGKIYMGENLLTNGKVYLFEQTKGNFGNSVVHNIFDGEFDYKNIKQGNYTLYVIPELEYSFNYFPKYLPTYTGLTHTWKNAVGIEVTTNNDEVDIFLVSYSDSFYGHKSISGEVNFGPNSKTFDNIPISILLFNEQKVPMDYKAIRKNMNRYSFNNLPNGNYYVQAEAPGISSEGFKINIGDVSTSEIIVNFIADNEEINFKIPDNENILPVVSNNNLLVYIKNQPTNSIVCELITVSGRTVIKKLFNTNEISLNTTGLAAGIYILKVKTFDNTFIETKKVYINNY